VQLVGKYLWISFNLPSFSPPKGKKELGDTPSSPARENFSLDSHPHGDTTVHPRRTAREIFSPDFSAFLHWKAPSDKEYKACCKGRVKGATNAAGTIKE
jgi:hypothetical protein